MFLTRLSFSSKTIVIGGITQMDIPNPHDSGLLHIRKKLQKVNEITFLCFNDNYVVRNPLVKRIIRAYDRGQDEK